jgi:hypothetical protein
LGWIIPLETEPLLTLDSARQREPRACGNLDFVVHRCTAGPTILDEWLPGNNP